jgi:hypothetical protein
MGGPVLPVLPRPKRKLRDRLDGQPPASATAGRFPVPSYVPWNQHVPGSIALTFFAFTHRPRRE